MPDHASPTKARATREYGGEVILHGDAAQCFELCRQLEKERDLTYVSSFDDLDLMTGHASLGLEIAEDLTEADGLLTQAPVFTLYCHPCQGQVTASPSSSPSPNGPPRCTQVLSTA